MSRELAVRPSAAPPVVSNDLIKAWLDGRNLRTMEAYIFDLDDFTRWMEAESKESAIAMLLAGGRGGANRIMLAYKAHLTDRRAKGTDRSLSSSTISRRLSTIRSLLKTARQIGKIDWKVDVEFPKKTKPKDMSGPGNDGWFAMRAALRRAARTPGPRLAVSKRDLALASLMHDRCLRRGECVEMDLEHFSDGDPPEVSIIGKGHRERELLEIAPETRDAIVDWIAVRGKEPGPLFVRLDPDALPGSLLRLGGPAASRMVTRLGRKVGLEKKARAHGLRHHGITRSLERNNGNIVEAMALARHGSPQQTVPYLDNLKKLSGKATRDLAADDGLDRPPIDSSPAPKAQRPRGQRPSQRGRRITR